MNYPFVRVSGPWNSNEQVNSPESLLIIVLCIVVRCHESVIVYSTQVNRLCSGGYRGVAMVSAETPSENSASPKFIDNSSCG